MFAPCAKSSSDMYFVVNFLFQDNVCLFVCFFATGVNFESRLRQKSSSSWQSKSRNEQVQTAQKNYGLCIHV